MYLWERPEWPHLTWDEQRLSPILAQASREQGSAAASRATRAP